MRFFVETSNVHDGNMSPRWGDATQVASNRTGFLERIGAPAHIVMLSIPTPNGAAIEVVDHASAGIIVADALITEARGLMLGLYTADCLPVAIADSVRGIVALAHCGWESTGARLARAVVSACIERGAHPSDMQVRIGPSIRRASYARPRERVSQIADPAWAPYLTETSGIVSIDLPAYVRAQCIEGGIPEASITTSDRDSYKDATCFSHQRSVERGEPEGRMLTVAALL